MELTKKELERQDFVDNTIFDLMETLNPTNKELDWNIEMISAIRDMIGEYFVSNKICEEKIFYPFINE